jgi:hypothetical protein
VLRWLLTARAILLVGCLLVAMMVAGALEALAQHDYVWAAFCVGSAALGWALLRRWRHPSARRRSRWPHSPSSRARRSVDPIGLAVLCERRVGMRVDAAVPATILSGPEPHCVLALAGERLWILADESRLVRPNVGCVIACWARRGLVAHVEHARRWERLELSCPSTAPWSAASRRRAQTADVFVGQLIAGEVGRAAG